MTVKMGRIQHPFYQGRPAFGTINKKRSVPVVYWKKGVTFDLKDQKQYYPSGSFAM